MRNPGACLLLFVGYLKGKSLPPNLNLVYFAVQYIPYYTGLVHTVQDVEAIE